MVRAFVRLLAMYAVELHSRLFGQFVRTTASRIFVQAHLPRGCGPSPRAIGQSADSVTGSPTRA